MVGLAAPGEGLADDWTPPPPPPLPPVPLLPLADVLADPSADGLPSALAAVTCEDGVVCTATVPLCAVVA